MKQSHQEVLDHILQEVNQEVQRDCALQNMLREASQRRDLENVENILTPIFAKINRRMDFLRDVALKAIEHYL